MRMHDFSLPALATLAIVALLFILAVNVGRQRSRYKIDAPATSGHPMLERAFRVQMNTLENVVLILPAMWVFATFVNSALAALLGMVWCLTRIWYAVSYMKDPKSRGSAFGASVLVIVILFLGALWRIVSSLI